MRVSHSSRSKCCGSDHLCMPIVTCRITVLILIAVLIASCGLSVDFDEREEYWRDLAGDFFSTEQSAESFANWVDTVSNGVKPYPVAKGDSDGNLQLVAQLEDLGSSLVCRHYVSIRVSVDDEKRIVDYNVSSESACF